MELNPTESAKKQIVLLGNGSRLEVSDWSRDKKYVSGRILDTTPPITVYVPVTYLASNIVKPAKKKRV